MEPTAPTPGPTPGDRAPVAPGPAGTAVGAPSLGLRAAPLPIDPDDPTAVRWSVAVPMGLDGPPGVLQGGLVAALLLALTRRADPFDAPLHALEVRLAAPTRTGVVAEVRTRPGDAGVHAAELRAGGVVAATGTVDLTGADPISASDLAALAGGPLPPPRPSPRYPTCFACGPDATHPAALHAPPGWVTDEAVLLGWVPDPDLADPVRPDRVDVAAVAALLACAGAWATFRPVVAAGAVAVLLGTFRLRLAGPVEPLDPVRVAARLDALDGRRARARAALVDTDGRMLALSDATYVAVDELPG